nr:glycoside hydrolase family 57 protein [Nitrosomonas nitrosa]
MNLWHLTPDAPRHPLRISPGEPVVLQIGSWPIEPGQAVWIEYQVVQRGGVSEAKHATADWQENLGPNSYWQVRLGPFADGDSVNYTVRGRNAVGEVSGPTASFMVGPKLYLALLWHQHQPIYKDTAHPAQAGSYLHPWVRLHALRDYYSMAALVAAHPGIHLTINLTPSLIWQIEDYTERGATDRALDLTLKPAEALEAAERKFILENFFEAHWHHQIATHPRYSDLFLQRREGRAFTVQDLRDLQMWFNLAWFGKEFREGEVKLVTGEMASVRHFVEQERNYSVADIEAMVKVQYKLMRAVLPLHRQLQAQGQIEVSTSPFFHPILPLLIDTDRATIDRPGATHPVRFSYPEDAEAQVRSAIEWYESRFAQSPRGMWPSEGAVSQSVIPCFARKNVRWLATDRGVLARSGQWGYDADNPDVLCQPYRALEEDSSLTIFFRTPQLSDSIGFRYQSYDDYEEAARDFIWQIKNGFVRHFKHGKDRVLTVALDGENAWGAYREDGRPFLQALYSLLERDAEIRTVTFSEYLDGNPIRGIQAHPVEGQERVHDLFPGSWIDESASAPGVDWGTWIGEEEENRGWELLKQAREFLQRKGATPETAPAAFQSLYIAEGSDWFWWFGGDQDSGKDETFDDLFRQHLKNIYRAFGEAAPPELDRHIVPHAVVWTHVAPANSIQIGDRLTVRTHCPGRLIWNVGDQPAQAADLLPVGGVMAGASRFQLSVGPFSEAGDLHFTFECTHVGCPGTFICCDSRPYRVSIESHSQL